MFLAIGRLLLKVGWHSKAGWFPEGELKNVAYNNKKSLFQIVDIIQYWLNLKEANANDKAEWKELYTFTQYYGLQDLSPQSLDILAQQLEPGINDTWVYNILDAWHIL